MEREHVETPEIPKAAVLDGLLSAQKGKVFFSSLRGDSAGADAIMQRFVRAGDGGWRVPEGGGVELSTITAQNISLTLSGLDAENVVVHLQAKFPSNVAHNFYVSLEGAKAEEALRFSNHYVGICNDAATQPCETKASRLYTFAVSPRWVSLYINGAPMKKKARAVDEPVSALVMKLIGDRSADLGAVIQGIEIWNLESEFKGFSEREDELLYEMLKKRMESRDLNGVCEWLASFDHLGLGNAEDELSELLVHELKKDVVRDWAYDRILARLSPERATEWRDSISKKLGQPAVEVDHVTVEFYRNPHRRLSLSRMLKREKLETFHVLNDVSFKVYRGDILGIIGANGAGKSTLLRVLSGLVPIDKGRILLRGNHLLLSPGLGIRNELSGRENIYLAGCFMGLSLGEINRLYPEIVEFSELGEFIDQPFKYYSDGMKSRLIFSIATSVAPDILMVDELLNAGDIQFQQKAAKRMDEMIQRAKVVIVITHSIPFVADKCNKALLIQKGKQVYYGDPDTAINHYLNSLHMPRAASRAPAISDQSMYQLQQQSFLPG